MWSIGAVFYLAVFFLRSAPAVMTAELMRDLHIGGASLVFGHANTWLILAAQGGVLGPIMTFTGLWGAPFLKARYGVEPKEAPAICSIMIVCWAVASPLFGAISDRIGKRKSPYLLGSMACACG